MSKITLNFTLYIILFLSTNLCIAKEMSLVLYQNNSFCKLILYSIEKNSVDNENIFLIESDVNITPLSSVNTLGRSGSLSWPVDAANFSAEGIPKLRKQYIKNIKDNVQTYKDEIILTSIVVSIAGYNTNKDNTNIFQEKIIEHLHENSFTLNTNDITFIDNEDFIRQAGIEALKDSCLDKNNYNSILVSLYSEYNVNYRLFNKKKQDLTEKPFIANDNFTGGYSELGRNTKKFFLNLPEDYNNYDRNNKILDKILSSQLNTELYKKNGDNLAHWLQKDYGRDNARGLAIIKYILDDNMSDNDWFIKQTNYLNEYIDQSLIQYLNSSIDSSVNQLDSLVSSNDYAVIFGEFLSNRYIKTKYLRAINEKIDEQKRRRILILNDEEYHLAFIKAAEKINKSNNTKEIDKKMIQLLDFFFYDSLYKDLKSNNSENSMNSPINQSLLSLLALNNHRHFCPAIKRIRYYPSILSMNKYLL